MRDVSESWDKRLFDMFSFCEQASTLVCYGTGDFAYILCGILAEYQLSPDAFCVSDGQEIDRDEHDGKSVYQFSHFRDNSEISVIVAMSAKWHEEIQRNLLDSSITKYYIVPEQDIKYMSLWGSIALNKVQPGWLQKEQDLYEEYYKKLAERYQYVELRAGFGGSVGGCLLELFSLLSYGLPKQDVYYLYSLINKEPRFCNCYEYPNRSVTSHFRGERFESVLSSNLAFWRYVLLRHRDFIHINTDYWYSQDVMESSILRLHEGVFRNSVVQGFSFTEEETHAALKLQAHMGLGEKFVCVYMRDAGYYQTTWKKLDESLHIMDKYRNSTLRNLRLATTYLYSKGYQSVRVGSNPLESLDGAGVIDYARCYHDALMDLYLASQCKFYVGDHSGVIFFQVLFGTPMVMINLPNITGYADGIFPFVRERDLAIYHKLWSPEKHRLLNLSEILDIEACSDEPYQYSGSVHVFEKYHEHGLIPIENTPEEILAVTMEMEQRLEGTMMYTAEDEALQRKFWKILDAYTSKHERVYWYDARVGRDFLRGNPWLTR